MRTILWSPARPRLVLAIVCAQALLIASFAIPAFILGAIGPNLWFATAVLVICVIEAARILWQLPQLEASAALTKRFVDAVRVMSDQPVVHRDSGTIFKALDPSGKGIWCRWTLMVADTEMLDDAMSHANLNGGKTAVTWRTFWAVPGFFGLVFSVADGTGITVTDEGDLTAIEEEKPQSRWVAAGKRLPLADRLIAPADEVSDLLDRLAEAEPLPEDEEDL